MYNSPKNSILLYLCVVMGLCMTITSTQAQSSTHTGNITVSTQAEVDALRTTLSGKTRIDGNLTVGYVIETSRSDITDLTPLSNIVRITGNLIIRRNGQLVNLNGLHNLQSITGGYFVVEYNDRLTTLDFPVLQTIEGYFSILRNNRLTTLGNFSVLTSIGMSDSVNIPSLNERKNNVSIVVEDNDRLFDCYTLTELLSGRVHAVSGNIYINNNNNNNDSNGDCNSQKGIINSIYQGNITVTTQPNALRGILVGKTTIRGNLTIGYTDNGSTRSDITDLVPLSNIVRITGNLNIQQNGQRVNLNGLNNLQTIGGYFSVQNNDSLTTLLGDFPALMSIGKNDSVNIPSLNERKNNVSIVVEDNPILSTCCVLTDFFLDEVNAVSGDIFINDNAMGCNSKSDINAITLTLTSSNEKSRAYNDTYPMAIDFTVGCGATGWTSAITYMPANANFITLSSTGGRLRETDLTGVSRRIDQKGVITLATPTENTGVERTATITLSTTGGTDTASQTVVVTQEALPNYVYVGNITVTTQARVNALRGILAGKTRIRGNLTIGYIDYRSTRSNITNLTPLSNITHITGNLNIQQNGHLVNLNGLNNLQSITRGDFRVIYNDQLTTLGNFPVLQTIGRAFYVGINDRLTTLGDFPALQTIGIHFSVLHNNGLTTLGDFSVLTGIGEGYNVYVPSLGGDRNNEVSIVVENNSRLSDCYTLTELLSGEVHAVRGDIYINNNATNGGCNTQNGIINSVYQGNITVTTQAQVNALRDTLAGKIRIAGNLTIGYTDNGSTRSNITDLTPLRNIVRIMGNLNIQQNGQLVNLNGFNNLQTIGGYFEVKDNDTLTFLGSFPVLTSIGITGGISISVSNNPRLSTCCVLTGFLPDGIHAVSGGILINDNAMGCDFESEINAITLTLTSSNETIAYNDTDFIAINFTVGCGATGWTSAIAYTPANANFITLSSTGETGQTGIITLMATPTGINTGVERTATITLSTARGIVSQTVVITQEALPDYIYLGDITVSTQAAVNALSDTLAGKTRIRGNLIIGYTSGSSQSNITNLTPLSNITHITGNLRIQQNGQPINLNGLDSLQSIEGDFQVNHNDRLTTLGNFPVLRSVGGDFHVFTNNRLTTLDFPGLQTIGGFFRVGYNDRLITLGGFPALTSIGIGALTRRNNEVSIVVENNSRLPDCYTLTEFLPGGTHAVSGSVTIQNNATGGSCNSKNGIINSIYQGSITVTTQAQVNALRDTLAGKTRVEGNLTIGYTSGNSRSDIIDLTSLRNIVRITGNLNIQQNGQLVNLNGFNNLQTIGGYFEVKDNDTLTFLGNFPALTSIGITGGISISVSNNPRLSTCCVLTDFFSDGVNAVSGDIFINDNAMGCNSESDINVITLTLTSSDDTIAYNDTDFIAIDFTVGCGATGWTSAITYMPAEANFITLSSTGRTGQTGVITLMATPRINTDVERTATIMLSTTGGTDTASQTVVIMQEALPDHIHVGDVTLTNQAQVDSIRSTLGDSRITAIRGNLIIRSSTDITHLDSLYFLTEITGNLEIRNNSMLEDVGDFPALDSIGGYFLMHNNAILRNGGDFPMLSGIGGYFLIRASDSLTSVGSFPRLATVGGYFAVRGTKILHSLYDFPSLTSIGTGNPYVPSRGVNVANTSIVVEGNPNLSDCYTLTEFLSDGATVVSGGIYINDNATDGGCNSPDEIIAAAPMIMLTSHADGESIAIAYDEVVAQTITFSIRGGATGWASAITGSDFITLDTTMNVADTGVVITVTATPTENTGVARSAVITFTTEGGVGDSATTMVTITQSASPPTLVVATNDTKIGHNSGNFAILFELGGTAVGWEVEVIGDDDFITLDPEGPNTSSTKETVTITAMYGENTGEERKDTIVFTTTDGVSDTVVIIQSASPPTLVVATNDTKIGHNSGNFAILFELGGTAVGWEVEVIGDDDFITLDPAGPNTSSTKETVTITAMYGENTGEERKDTIVFTTTDGVSDTVVITQSASPPTLVVATNDTKIGHNSGSFAILFELGGTAVGWEAEIIGDDDFITLDPAGPNTSSTKETVTITAMYGENTGEERKDTIVFTTTDGVSDTVIITQAAAPTIMLTSHTDGDSIAIAHNDTDSRPISFTLGGSATSSMSSISYMPENANFITLEPENNDEETRTITLTPSANTSAEPRTATITLRTTGHEGTPDSVSLTIMQGKSDTTTLSTHTKELLFMFYPNPTEGTLTIEGVTRYLQMHIYDLVGREVMTYSLTPLKKTIDVSELPSGMYVATLQGEGKTWKEVLMKR